MVSKQLGFRIVNKKLIIWAFEAEIWSPAENIQNFKIYSKLINF